MDRLHALTLGDVAREHRRSRPQKVAAVCGGTRLTFPELDDRVNRLANALRARGFGPGDRLLWLAQNCHRLLESMLAVAKLGGVVCPANWRQEAPELAFVLDDTRPAVVMWQEDEVGRAVRDARAAAEAAAGALWVRHDGGEYEDLLAEGSTDDPEAEIDVDPASPVVQIYTAAFSGRPNGALLSHTAVLLQDLVTAAFARLSGETVYLVCGPLFHVWTLGSMACTFHFGGTNVFTPRVDPEELCQLIHAEGCTDGFVFGPTIDRMVEVNHDCRYNLKTFRSFPHSPEWDAMVTINPARDAQGMMYGQTEVSGLLTSTAFGPGLGGHGRPSPLVTVRIVDPDGNEVPPGEVGEIVARGPTAMNGYLHRPDLNAERQAGGWHHTGDLGRREEDGSITFIGPKTRMIKSAAENIYPVEVEQCIARHPAVRECAVIGLPDPVWVQRVLAVVVLAEGATATEAEIVEHCRANMASYKKPRSVVFVDALPRSGFAVDYDELDRRYGGGGYPGAGSRSI